MRGVLFRDTARAIAEVREHLAGADPGSVESQVTIMDTERLKAILRDLFAAQTIAVLSTQGAEFPHASLVAFAASDDLKTLVFATLRNTRKYANMERDPRVALTVDSRTASNADLLHTVVATAFGTAAEVPPEERGLWEDIFLARHPSLREFVTSPGCALMAVSAQSCDIITGFQNVSTLSF
jgi:nitroimidazol reductase NimA-like FMN-containing flavoprotein (pyridoxamine 5'-phosphate oxidase superfamily)